MDNNKVGVEMGEGGGEGWGGGEGCGEKAENYTWTTIKKLKNKNKKEPLLLNAEKK